MNRGTILLRVDGSATEGMGRIARCLALANALQRRRYQMTFISRVDNNHWPDRIRRFRHTVSKSNHPAGKSEDLDDLLRDIARTSPAVVVTDSPNIGEDYLETVAAHVPLLVSMDDSARTRFPSELVINPTLGHASSEYDLAPGTQLVSGDRYAMIRAEFRRARHVRATEPGGSRRVLLALGGGEVAHDTYQYARALLKTKEVGKVDAVLGSSKESRELLDALVAEFADAISVTADARDLGARMTKAHLLITGGGNTALEAACVGVPMLLVTRHAYLVPCAVRLEETGVAQYLGPREKVSAGAVAEAAIAILDDNFERKAMSRSGRMLIDGRGADRIVTASEILLRRVRRVVASAA